MVLLRLAAAACALTTLNALAQNRLPVVPVKTVTVQACPFTGGSGREDSM